MFLDDRFVFDEVLIAQDGLALLKNIPKQMEDNDINKGVSNFADTQSSSF